mmetsp:Transcript_5268/g.4456  ORF Transcript_5268/g.4456 Transcript_5268/m.4456 type:complete len:359 (-) Transcript_5268:107-1183(-)
MNKGRYREFYQCDYDVAGSYGLMIPDAECVYMMNEIFSQLDLGKTIIKINNRKFLDAIIELAGAPRQKFKTICSSIDKLDKEDWKEVKRELIEEKGLTEQMANKIGEFVELKGNPTEMIELIKTKGIFKGSEQGEAAIKEFEVLIKYLEDLKCTENVLFDLSLARGLDYYTGIIYEAILVGGNVGSIAGGGRYDGLVGMFSNKDIPAVGFSIGIERVFAILEEKYSKDPNLRPNDTQVLVCSLGKNLQGERFKVCKELWEAGVNAETLYNDNPDPKKQLNYALKGYIPLIIWIGEDEIKNNKLKIKLLYKGDEIFIERSGLIKEVNVQIEKYREELAKGLVEFAKPDEGGAKEKKGGK